MKNQKKAVILSSGGLDSTTVMAIARKEGYRLHSLSFNYGQRHIFELQAAERVADFFDAAEHLVMNIDMRMIGGSSLTDNIDVPKNRDKYDTGMDIPATYVPARNTVFLSCALAWAEVLNAFDIFIGVNAIDYSGYPDCRPEFISAFQTLANLATKAGVEGKTPFAIHAPLIKMTKAEIIELGDSLGVDYAITHSCYDPTPDGLACGGCDSCLLRREGFLKAGIKDPTRYSGG